MRFIKRSLVINLKAIGLATVLVVSSGCTPFAAVRSADIIPGRQLAAQLSWATPPGAWFWSFDCASDCNRRIPGLDVTWLFGGHPADVNQRSQFGIGYVFPMVPYVEAYFQTRSGPRAAGIGGRLGAPIWGWAEHRLYGRFNVPLKKETLLLNPTLYLHAGNSPNGENPGFFLAFVQGIGLYSRGEHATIAPALSVGAGWGHRRSYTDKLNFFSAFAVVSLNLVVHQKQ